MKILMLMDDLATINYKVDANFALLLEAKRRDYSVFYATIDGLFLEDGVASCKVHRLAVFNQADYYHLTETAYVALHTFDVVLMRKDPPYDLNYHNATQILSIAKAQGAMVVNDPQALRDANEKLAAAWFPKLCPPTLISADKNQMHDFLKHHKEVICKPLNAMAGIGITRLKLGDGRFDSVYETLSHKGQQYFIMQTFLLEVTQGDKRIILINGEPGPYGFLRIPKAGSYLANLHKGGSGVISPLTDQERFICKTIGETLAAKGLSLVGIDVIANHLTEINVTCPGCLQEIDSLSDSYLCGKFFDFLESKTSKKQ